MTVSLHHVHLVTASVEEFCAFFVDNFDAEIVFDDLIDNDRNVFLTIGTGRIHLFESKQPPARRRNAFHHIGLLIDGLADVQDRLRANGVALGETVSVPGGAFVMAEGPDGLLLELFEVTSPEHRRFFVSA